MGVLGKTWKQRLALSVVGILALQTIGIQVGLAQDGDPKGNDESVVSMEAVTVEGQRIENIEDVKKEFAKRPASNILN